MKKAGVVISLIIINFFMFSFVSADISRNCTDSDGGKISIGEEKLEQINGPLQMNALPNLAELFILKNGYVMMKIFLRFILLLVLTDISVAMVPV